MATVRCLPAGGVSINGAGERYKQVFLQLPRVLCHVNVRASAAPDSSSSLHAPIHHNFT